MKSFGTLYIVATPIGNLADITLRALETLKKVDLIAAEDTRHSDRLLKHYAITTRTISLHDFNEAKRSQFLLAELQQGKNIALISDAGTPLISDPGYHLVKVVRDAGIKIEPIPGPCAAICALSASGLPTDKFIFEGFLPAKTKQQCERLQELAGETRTIIVYESTHRLLALIENIVSVFGSERKIVVAKELTKAFETIYSGSISEIQKWLLEDEKRQKGEFVILLAGKEAVSQAADIEPEVLRILNILLKELPCKQAVALTAEITGANKNQLYRIAIK